MKQLSTKKIQELTSLSLQVRRNILKMITDTKSSHIGSAYSMVDLITVLYSLVLTQDSKNPNSPKRDRFILSKGHACAALYSLLAELGYFKRDLLKSFAQDGSILMSHINFDVPGVEFSTGSLGHALPVGVGVALSAKKRGSTWRTFILVSDGELNEGSNWEAFLMAAHLQLDNLTVIVDRNGLQGLGPTEGIIDMNPLDKKAVAFGWDAKIIDGHDYQQIFDTVDGFASQKNKKPKIIIADTIKGKGVSFMERKVAWHYKSPSQEEYDLAHKELEK
jgi:transketolase